MVRIPALLVALAVGLALNAGTFALAQAAALSQAPIALLPLSAALGGFVAARWAQRTAPVPGFAVGLLLVACQIGAALGPYPALQPFLDPRLLLLQIIAAISGGLTGTVLVRRIGQVAPAISLRSEL